MRDLLKKIEEHGEALAENSKPAHVDVALRSERVTIRLSVEEADAMDRYCAALGIGRSTLLRVALRHLLGLDVGHQGLAKEVAASSSLVTR